MFLRIVKAAGGKGVQHEYVRLVESYREAGKVKQRLVASLGRKDLIAAHLDSLIRLVKGEDAPEEETKDGAAAQDLAMPEALQAWDWGAMLVARSLWAELGLGEIIDRLEGRQRRATVPLADRVLALVANRLEAPGSEHGLAGWLETSFVCDRHGRRFVPCWRGDDERKASRAPRVRVAFSQLQRWYRSLDGLIAHKPEIEKQIFLRLRQLFCLEVDLVLYDLTSSYFEGQGPARAAHGYSRDGKPRNRQVLIGLVMVDGWPLAHHLFEGHRRDATTVPEVLADLKKRFGLARVVFVGDRGMISRDNLALLRAAEQGYILARRRRRSPGAAAAIAQAEGPDGGPWRQCPVGITAAEKAEAPKTRVCEVAPEEPDTRLLVVHSEERQAFEQARRQKAMARVRQALEALASRVSKGRLKAAEDIGAAVGRILAQDHGHRYFDWALENGCFRFFEHPLHYPREVAGEGKYLLQTEGIEVSAVQVVQLYKQLSEVERGFRSLKDILAMRPIYHRTDPRVEAHIFVAALAFLLQCALDKKLKAAGLDFSAEEALVALKSLKVVDIKLGGAKTRRCVTNGSERARRILAALGIKDRNPPQPPKGAKPIM